MQWIQFVARHAMLIELELSYIHDNKMIKWTSIGLCAMWGECNCNCNCRVWIKQINLVSWVRQRTSSITYANFATIAHCSKIRKGFWIFSILNCFGCMKCLADFNRIVNEWACITGRSESAICHKRLQWPHLFITDRKKLNTQQLEMICRCESERDASIQLPRVWFAVYYLT